LLIKDIAKNNDGLKDYLKMAVEKTHAATKAVLGPEGYNNLKLTRKLKPDTTPLLVARGTPQELPPTENKYWPSQTILEVEVVNEQVEPRVFYVRVSANDADARDPWLPRSKIMGISTNKEDWAEIKEDNAGDTTIVKGTNVSMAIYENNHAAAINNAIRLAIMVKPELLREQASAKPATPLSDLEKEALIKRTIDTLAANEEMKAEVQKLVELRDQTIITKDPKRQKEVEAANKEFENKIKKNFSPQGMDLSDTMLSKIRKELIRKADEAGEKKQPPEPSQGAGMPTDGNAPTAATTARPTTPAVTSALDAVAQVVQEVGQMIANLQIANVKNEHPEGGWKPPAPGKPLGPEILEI
jgi:hypothetical protein